MRRNSLWGSEAGDSPPPPQQACSVWHLRGSHRPFRSLHWLGFIQLHYTPQSHHGQGCLQSTATWNVWNLVQIRSLKRVKILQATFALLGQFAVLQVDCKWAQFRVGDPCLSPHFHTSGSRMICEDSFLLSFPPQERINLYLSSCITRLAIYT